MIKVTGQDPARVLRQFPQHVVEYQEMVNEFAKGLLFGNPLARTDEEINLHQSRTGIGSWGLWMPNGNQYHFRPAAKPPIVNVYDSFRNGSIVARLYSPAEMRKFARTVR